MCTGRAFFVASRMLEGDEAGCCGPQRAAFCQISFHIMAILFPPNTYGKSGIRRQSRAHNLLFIQRICEGTVE